LWLFSSKFLVFERDLWNFPPRKKYQKFVDFLSETPVPLGVPL